MFSSSGIESGFLVLPFTPPELLGAKMILVYVTEALLGAFILIVAMVIYGIKEGPPAMFYLNGLLSAFALPLLPTALAYLVIVPLMNASKLFRNKNFILYVGGFLGMGFALAFNFYIQSVTSKFGNPQAAALFANPESMMARLGKAWLPTWLAWKAFDGAASPLGFLAALGNLGLGLGCAAGVAALLGKAYVRSLQAYSETSAAKKKPTAAGKGIFGPGMIVKRPLLRTLVAREIRLMNREPMYLLNGPFVMILMPALMAVIFAAQREALAEMSAAIAPLLQGPGGYLVPAAFGAFLGSSTSIACTAVSRDAKALPWIRSLPIAPVKYFAAKLLHAEVFAVIGSLIGCVAGVALFHTAALDAVIALLLAGIVSTALNMGGLCSTRPFPGYTGTTHRGDEAESQRGHRDPLDHGAGRRPRRREPLPGLAATTATRCSTGASSWRRSSPGSASTLASRPNATRRWRLDGGRQQAAAGAAVDCWRRRLRRRRPPPVLAVLNRAESDTPPSATLPATMAVAEAFLRLRERGSSRLDLDEDYFVDLAHRGAAEADKVHGLADEARVARVAGNSEDRAPPARRPGRRRRSIASA